MTGPVRVERALTGCVDAGCLDRILDLLTQTWMDSDDVDPVDRIGFETAVIEVAGNIVQHSDRSQAFQCWLVIRIFADTLYAEFTDTAAAVRVDLDAVGMPDELAESGRGLAMARAAVDELSYHRSDGRNHWRIGRRRTGSTRSDSERCAR